MAEDKLDSRDTEIQRLKNAYSKMNNEVCQVLGKALGYPWFKDDQQNFPGATENAGVCVGEHVAESIAAEAAIRLESRDADLRAVVEALQALVEAEGHAQTCRVVLSGGCSCGAWELRNVAQGDAARVLRLR